LTQKSFIALLQNPELLDVTQTIELEKIIQKYPYFQPARALFLKGLYQQSSFKYNIALKETAAITTDRSILFEFITSQNFKSISFYEHQTDIDESVKLSAIDFNENEAIKNHIIESDVKIIENNPNKTVEEKLEIGKPLVFGADEKHSFEEWLQLTQIKKIQRIETNQELNNTNLAEKSIDINSNPTVLEVPKTDEISKKLALIDKFIETNPKIISNKNDIPFANSIPKIQESSHLMTETLAKIYLEQKKYQRAIQAYEILILKYPEKSYFFADRIEDIKKLQQNNS
jgi:tetratricopeptide (TPR) repeat protein